MMEDVSPSDCFEVRRESRFSSDDEDYLHAYYAPIVGLKAVALFSSFLRLQEGESFSHEAFFKKLQLSSGEFGQALRPLEAIGLVVAYRQKTEKCFYFVYCLYAPKNPKEFFGNALFAGTLRRYLSPNECEAIARRFDLLTLPEGYENVSEKFTDYFAPDFDSPLYNEAALATGGRAFAPLDTGFDKNHFFAALLDKDERLGEASLSKEEIVKVARLSALYSYDEAAMADFVVESYGYPKPFGSRVDFAKLASLAQDNLRFTYDKKASDKTSEAHGDAPLAKMLRKMDALTPVEFLTALQKGHRPAKSDLDLLNILVGEMGLPAPSCNALVFYILKVKDNVLSSAYAHKLAGSLVRQGSSTALDALNYLGKTTSYHKPKKEDEAKPALTKEKTSEATSPKKEEPAAETSDEEYDRVMDEYSERIRAKK
jgi:replication initiation and membrane attachment protein DnaB